MKSFYGFSKPYNFQRAFPFLTASFFLLLIIGIMPVMALFGKLDWGKTYRFLYFLYIGSIALAAAALSFMPRIAWLLIALCFIEISLGLGTTVLVNVHVLRNSLLPKNLRLSDDTWNDYQFHPLLQIVPRPNVLRLSPFKIQHDSYGLRGAERDKNRLRQQIVIATVGGSYDL